MSQHTQLGSHTTYGPVMTGPKGGVYVLYNGKKYYGAEYAQGPKFTKGAGVSDAMVAAASKVGPAKATPKEAGKPAAAHTSASEHKPTQSATSAPKTAYNSFAGNKATDPSWNHEKQLAHAKEHGKEHVYVAQQKAYHEKMLKDPAKQSDFDQNYHKKKIAELDAKDPAKAEPAKAIEPHVNTTSSDVKATVAALTTNLPKAYVYALEGSIPNLKQITSESNQVTASLSPSELSITKSFTGGSSSQLRKAIATGEGPHLSDAKTLQNAIVTKGVKAQADTYRGMGVSSPQLHSLLTSDHFSNSGMSSSSYSIEKAFSSFTGLGGHAYDGNPKEHKVVLRFKRPTGLPVTTISLFKSEKEVILPHAKKYNIVERHFDSVNKVHIITAEEAD